MREKIARIHPQKGTEIGLGGLNACLEFEKRGKK